MKLFQVKKKKKSNWSVRFAFLPTKVEHNYKYYPQLNDQGEAEAEDDCSIYTTSKTEHWYIWFEFYRRYYNYGCPVNYYITKRESDYLRKS